MAFAGQDFLFAGSKPFKKQNIIRQCQDLFFSHPFTSTVSSRIFIPYVKIMLHSSYNNEHCREFPLKSPDGNKLRVASDFYHLLDDRFYLLGSDRSFGWKFYQKRHLYFHRMGLHIFIFDHKGLPEKK